MHTTVTICLYIHNIPFRALRRDGLVLAASASVAPPFRAYLAHRCLMSIYGMDMDMGVDRWRQDVQPSVSSANSRHLLASAHEQRAAW